MKILINDKNWKVKKIIPTQPGDMVVISSFGTTYKSPGEEIKIWTPFFINHKVYAEDAQGNVSIFAAYHSDEFGFIDYANLAETSVLNYDFYCKTMQLIGKEPTAFIDHMMSVVNENDCDRGIWEDEIKKT